MGNLVPGKRVSHLPGVVGQSGLVRRLFGFLVFIVLVPAGCATVDFDYPKETSKAPTDTDETFLGQAAPIWPRGSHPITRVST